MDPGADSGTYLTYSHNINELPDIKKEKEEAPLMITFPVMKAEVKVSLIPVLDICGLLILNYMIMGIYIVCLNLTSCFPLPLTLYNLQETNNPSICKLNQKYLCHKMNVMMRSHHNLTLQIIFSYHGINYVGIKPFPP
jgi:hypothetical protein